LVCKSKLFLYHRWVSLWPFDVDLSTNSRRKLVWHRSGHTVNKQLKSLVMSRVSRKIRRMFRFWNIDMPPTRSKDLSARIANLILVSSSSMDPHRLHWDFQWIQVEA
jgi:hypothetical protein